MAVIQRLRRFTDPPGPPMTPGLPGQMAVSMPVTGITSIYFAVADGSWINLLDEWRDQANGLAGLDNLGKLSPATIPQATTAAMGGGHLANEAEAIAGLNTEKLITPATLAAALASAGVVVFPASETVAGIAEIATAGEVTDGLLDDKIITPLKFKPYLDNIATATAKNVEQDGRLTTLETDGGTLAAAVADHETRIGALELSVADLGPRMTAAETDIAALEAKTGTATTTVQGIAELATQAEVNTGAAGALIVTPETLAARLAAMPATVYASQAEVNAGTEAAKAISPATLRGLNGWFTGPIGIGSAPTGGYIFEIKPSPATVAYMRLNAGAANAAGFVLTSAREYAFTSGPDSMFTLWDNTAGAPRMQIGIDGRVGMGVAADASSQLHIYRTGFAQMHVQSDANGQAVLALSGNRKWSLNAMPVAQGGQFWIYDNTAGATAMTINQGSGDFQVAFGNTLNNWSTIMLNNQHRVWVIQNEGTGAGLQGYFRILDNTAGQERLVIDTGGHVQIQKRTDGHGTLGITCQADSTHSAVLYLNGWRNWDVRSELGEFRVRDGTAGLQRMAIDVNGKLWLSSGAWISAYGLEGGFGGSGVLRGHTSANAICFRWSNTALLYRIDEVVERHMVWGPASLEVGNFQVANHGGSPTGVALYCEQGGTGRYAFVDASSDPRLKRDIAPTKIDALAAINAVDVIEYNWDFEACKLYNQPETGFVPLGVNAAQLRDLIPEMAVMGMDGLLRLNTKQGVPWLIRAVQQLSARVVELEGRYVH